jgi:hypothetical protein
MKNGKESAYPSEKWIDGGHPMLDNVKIKTAGLTKREYFAGLAMQGIMTNVSYPLGIKTEIVASKSIELADELLKQLGE